MSIFHANRFFSRFASAVLIMMVSVIGLFGQSKPFFGKAVKADGPELSGIFKKWNVYELDATALKNHFLAQANRVGQAKLELGSEFSWELNLAPAMTVSAGVLSATEAGKSSFFYDPTYSGSVLDQNGATGRTALVINNDWIEGVVEAGGEMMNVQPLFLFQPDAPRNQYIVYADSWVKETISGTCGAHEIQQKAQQLHDHAHGLGHDDDDEMENMLVPCFTIELAVATDFSMFTKYGSTVAGVQNHILAVIAAVNTVYTGSFANNYQFTIIEWYNSTSAAGNTWVYNSDAGTMLSNFTSWGNTNFGSSFDLGEWWTNLDFAGSTIGIAWVGTLCGNNGFHCLQDFTSTIALLRNLTAHEIGHNLNLGHDASGSNTIMAPAVNTSTTWSAASINGINSYVPNFHNTCLSSCGGSPTPPVAAYSFSPSSPVCQGVTVSFTDNSTNTPTSWLWTFPSGTPATSTLQNPTCVWSMPGTYTISLKATNAGGSNTTTQQITILALPTANFSFVKVGANVTFTNTSTNATSYFWDFGDGESSTDFSPTHTYLNDGTYLVNLTATNSCGDRVKTATIVIATPPTADFVANPTSGCTPQTIQFTNTSSSNAAIFQWSFPGGLPPTSTMQNPTVQYLNPGIFSVSLTVSNPQGSDSEVKTNYISISQKPHAAFSTSFQGPQTVVFTNTSTGPPTLSYAWNFGDNQTSTMTSPTHMYAVDGTYLVRLIATNACGPDTMTTNVVISSQPVAAFSASPQSGCAPLSVNFNSAASANATSFSWAFPGGSPASSTAANPAVIFSNAGIYTVTLTATNANGSNTATKTITVSTVPATAFSFTTAGSTATFTNASQNATTQLWAFGDNTTSVAASPSHTYVNDGTYQVTLTSTNACGSTTATQTVVIVTPVQAAFSASQNSICPGATVQFTNNSSANATIWFWQFSGGSPATSTSQSAPPVIFSNAGTYTVTLTASNAGFSSTATQVITVNPLPTAAFGFTINGSTATFSNTSSNTASQSWNFGDSQTSTAAAPSHTYSNDGVYQVVLTTQNGCGTATSTQTVTIVTPVTAAFSASQNVACAGSTLQFSNNSSSNATAWNWQFPGGSPASATTQNAPAVLFSNAGAYTVSLTVSNAGFTQTATQNIVINPLPTAGFTASTTGQTAIFSNTSQNATSQNWNFGNGQTSTLANPTMNYGSDGSFTVVLTSTNGCGTATSTQVVSLNTPPTAAFLPSVSSGCAPLAVNFLNQSSANANSYNWTFAGGSPSSSTAQNPSVTYSVSGSYVAALTVSNASGSSTTQSTITVSTTPTTAFSSAISNFTTVNFANNTTGATSQNWDFGDSQTSSAVSPTHVFATDGNYTVVLTSTNGCGTSTFSQNVVIVTPPTAAFSPSTNAGCTPFVVNFSNQSSANSTSYNWQFPGGSPATSTLASPSVTYSVSGSYVATLTVSNAAGSNTTQQTITTQTAPTAAFSIQKSGFTTVSFSNTTTGTAPNFSWNFGDGSAASTDVSPTHVYQNDGTYTVVLTATNGCGTSTSTQNVVIVTPPLAMFSASPTTGCAPQTVNFSNQSSANASSLLWSFPGGSPSASNDPNPNVTYSVSGSYVATLTATNAAGSSVFEVQIGVGQAPTAGFTTQTAGVSAVFTNTSTGVGNAYLWNFGNGQTSTETNPTHNFGTTGTFMVILKVTNPCGQSETTQEVVIAGSAPIPTFSATPTTACAPATVAFLDASPGQPTAWQWSFQGGTPSNSAAQNPTVSYPNAGVFDVILQVTNIFGSNTQTFSAAIMMDQTIIPTYSWAVGGGNFTVNFTNTSTGGAGVCTWNFGDNTTSTEANPTHVFPNAGTFQVTLTCENACGEVSNSQNVVVLTSTSNTLAFEKMQLFPNPTDGAATLEIESGTIQNAEIELSVLDVLGRIVIQTEKAQMIGGTLKKTFDLSKLPSANYIVRVRSGEKAAFLKLVLNK